MTIIECKSWSQTNVNYSVTLKNMSDCGEANEAVMEELHNMSNFYNDETKGEQKSFSIHEEVVSLPAGET